MIIVALPSFNKAFKKRIFNNKSLVAKTYERVEMFKSNPNNPIIHNHPLKGSRIGYRAFSVTGDIRIIYRYRDSDTAIFLDIGSHNQIY